MEKLALAVQNRLYLQIGWR